MHDGMAQTLDSEGRYGCFIDNESFIGPESVTMVTLQNAVVGSHNQKS